MIEFQDAGFAYPRAEVLRQVSLTIAPGGFDVVLGAPGAGKTTFLRLCHGGLAPTSGAVRHFGAVIAPGNRDAIAGLRRRVGLVDREAGFLEHLTLAENVALPLTVRGAPPGSRAEDLAALLDWVGLRRRGAALPRELTAGDRLRAALARAVFPSPEVVLADEPAVGVGAEAAGQVVALLVELNRMGRAVVLATQDADLAEWAETAAAARVLRLEAGRIAPRARAAAGAGAGARMDAGAGAGLDAGGGAGMDTGAGALIRTGAGA